MNRRTLGVCLTKDEKETKAVLRFLCIVREIHSRLSAAERESISTFGSRTALKTHAGFFASRRMINPGSQFRLSSQPRPNLPHVPLSFDRQSYSDVCFTSRLVGFWTNARPTSEGKFLSLSPDRAVEHGGSRRRGRRR